MSSAVLETLSTNIKKARNLAYFGRYPEAKDDFTQVIDRLQKYISRYPREIIRLKDSKLIAEWNRLLQEIKKERFEVEQMISIMNHVAPPQRIIPKQNQSFKEDSPKAADGLGLEERKERKKYPFNAEPFKKYHEDDQIYIQKRREENKDEKDPLDWGPPPPKFTKPTKKDKIVGNKSNVSNQPKKRDEYPKPWQANAKKQGKQPEDTNERKTYLKHVYPQGSGPDADLINLLERQVIDLNPNVKFEDIAQLQKAKELLAEAVLMPLHMPQLFKGIRRAWKGVLMFGPPGTGKTMLAKAIASTGKTTFFNVTSSSLASKWKGQSQKLVRILFQMARFYAPTTLFFDEIDALASKRGDKDDDSSRKVKTQLLTSMDGANTGEDQKKVVVIGATNRPWDLDQAIRRRLEKRIYIPLPTDIGRRELLKICLKQEQLGPDFDPEVIVKETEGYSGADISNLCREAAYIPMRKKLREQGGFRKIENIQKFEQEVNVPLSMEDFKEAVRNVKPSVGTQDMHKYEEWMKEFGEQGTN